MARQREYAGEVMDPWNMKMPRSMKEKIEAKARQEKRSTANMARVLIERGLAVKKK